MFVMFAGVGIIGALASILASILVPPPDNDDWREAPGGGASSDRALHEEFELVRRELSALRPPPHQR
jgi:hypothetical protein